MPSHRNTNHMAVAIFFWVAGLLISTAGQGIAMDRLLLNPRALGMGGARVASVDDVSAQYYNPAAFGFMGRQSENEEASAVDNNHLGRKKWGWELGASGGYRVHNDLGRLWDDLLDIDIDDLSENGIQTESDLQELVNLALNLEGLDDPGNAISVDLSADTGFRMGHFAVGGYVMAEASARVLDLDTSNLGISYSVEDLNQQIDDITLSGNDNQTLLFTSEQQTMLADAGLDSDAIQKLDYTARQQGITEVQAAQMVSILSDIADQSLSGGGGDIEDNTTTVLLNGFGLLELPFSYGRAINDHIAVGGNLKLMTGRVYATEVVVFDNDAGDILEEADKNYEESTTFGIDLGALARLNAFNFGVVARNLNSPTFNGPTVGGTRFDDVTVAPQVTAGVAYIPFDNLIIEMDLDLTYNETTLDDYETRNLALGIEWDVWRFLALRAGAYKNMSEDDIGWVYTAGLGFNFWAVRLDMAAAMTSETEQLEDDELPKELRAAMQLSIDF